MSLSPEFDDVEPGPAAAVAVYCGSGSGSHPMFLARARELGAHLASLNISLVYGGGDIGMMGAVADAVMSGGGEVIGVIPQRLVEVEVAHHGVTRLEVTANMHERKARMIELAGGFIAMPGGFGTYEEVFEVLTWN
ncbi:MAG: TIGR00730 family Rossman fold protein, partial [Ilumatobacteraceae bacterium]